MKVSIREFKTHLSRYLAQAQTGEALDITSHSKVVARIVGVPPTESAGIARLVGEGVAQWAGGKPTGATIALPSGGKAVSEMVLEDRG